MPGESHGNASYIRRGGLRVFSELLLQHDAYTKPCLSAQHFIKMQRLHNCTEKSEVRESLSFGTALEIVAQVMPLCALFERLSIRTLS